jgi:WD40 repeat protein
MSQSKQFDLIELDVDKFDITKELLSGTYSEDIIKEYICLVCLNIATKPKSCNCEVLFCSKCIDASLKKSKSCPSCRKTFKEKPVPRKISNILNSFLITCPNSSTKCTESIKLEFINQHLKTCKATKRVAKCNGCKKEVQTTNELIEMQKHVEECPELPAQCVNCQRSMKKKELVSHSKVCIYKLVECEDCFTQIRESEINKHGRKECAKAVRDYYENKIAEMLKIYEPEKSRKVRTQPFNDAYHDLITSKKKESYSVNNVSNLIETPNQYVNNVVREQEKEVVADMELEKEIRINGDYVNCFIKMDWKLNDNTIVTGGFRIIVWDIDAGEQVRKVEAPNGHICNFLVQAKLYQNDCLVISSGEKGIYVFDIAKGSLNSVISHDALKVHSILYLDPFSTASRIVAGSRNKVISIYKLSTGVVGTKINNQSVLDNKEPVNCMEYINWKRDQNTIAVGGDMNVSIWDIHNRIKIRLIEVGHKTCSLLYMKWEMDDVTLLSGGYGKVKAWNVDTTECLERIKSHDGNINCLMQMNWIIDDVTIVGGGDDKTIKLIDVVRENVIAINEHDYEVKGILQINNALYSVDSRYLKKWNIKIKKLIDS